jgi:hypothetical protein
MNLPSGLEHMFEETRNDFRIACSLLEIADEFEVRPIFVLEGRGCEWHIDLFAGYPLVEDIFYLKEELVPCDYKNNLTYHRQYKGNGSHWKSFVFRKLRVYNTIIFFILEPHLIDNSLYNGGPKYPRFRLRILDVKCQQK